DTDTAEEVVNEMIQEQVLPAKYQHLITGEINRILREMTKPTAEEHKKREDARLAAQAAAQAAHLARTGSLPRSSPSSFDAADWDSTTRDRDRPPLPPSGASSGGKVAEGVSAGAGSGTGVGVGLGAVSGSVSTPIDIVGGPSRNTGSLPRKGSVQGVHGDEFEDFPMKEYANDIPILELVQDTAMAANRGMDKAKEWLAKLEDQDIMTVGDLRDLHDEDWSSL
ncbi:hypothetical protein BDK51DRAFT_29108, partial [Blyttiomyces helicus]